MVAEAHVLPNDALNQLAACDVSWRGAGPDRVVLSATGTEHEVVTLPWTLPGVPEESVIEDARRPGLPIVVTSPYVTSRLAPRLRELGLHHVDTAGNASIRLPGMFVEVTGRPREAPSRPRGTGPTGRRSGVRVILTLLARPERAGELTVREIARAAGVSVGSAQATLADLRERRFLYDGGLDRTALLFEGWLAGYLADRRLQEPEATFEHHVGWADETGVREAMAAAGAVVGGEDAAALLGLPLRGASGIVYALASPAPVVRAARLRRTDDGHLQWRKKWWLTSDESGVAPTPLVYADLLASDDPRQSEIAAELRRTDALLRRLDAN